MFVFLHISGIKLLKLTVRWHIMELRKRTSTATLKESPDDDLDCPVCFKVYSREDSLLHHMESVHGEAAKCSVCEKVLSSHQALLRHRLTHTNDRSFKCKICPKTFSRPDTCKYHEKHVHWEECGGGGEQIFISRQCRWCLDKGHSNHHLVFFMKSGESRSKHQCLICLGTYAFCLGDHKHNLDEIPRSKGFQCSKCYLLLSSEKTLTRHKCETVPKSREPTFFPIVSYL